MLELLKKLCAFDAVSGNEANLRNFIISEIEGFCEYKTDALGNLICFKKGRNASIKKLMLDAHMDEVGLIITCADKNGFLRFKTVGGIDTAVMLNRRVRINSKINGVIGLKPIHLLSGDEGKKLPKADSLYIDIGAQNEKEALELVSIGDTAVICGDFTETDGSFMSKAVDDRIGCAVLITLLKQQSEYDFYAVFSVQEEVGTRGAKTAAYSINPDAALVLEATTAADIAGVSEEKKVCNLGKGPVISFMDRSTVYDKQFYNAAVNGPVPCQIKRAVAGGNNSGSVHLSREGVRTLAISLPCRYIHSAACVGNVSDTENMLSLVKYMLNGICSGSIQ